MSIKIAEILTYNWNGTDSLINYAALALSVVPLAFQNRTSLRDAVGWAAGITFLAFFQIWLCFVEECVGISVIWCAILGILWVQRLVLNRKRVHSKGYDKSLQIASAYGLGACAYYAAVEEPITTVAHVCAIVLGCCMGMVGRICSCKVKERTPKDE